jgi:rare lipoprotein A (peptidoglycan hydrolase)
VVIIAALALVVAPGSVGSRNPASNLPLDSSRFQAVDLSRYAPGATTTTPTADPAYRSADSLSGDSALLEPDSRGVPARPVVNVPLNKPGVLIWNYDPNVSFYGPGFYGKRTACGLAYTPDLLGVAHRTLPCGTRVTFKNPANGRTITVPVIDRGPYVDGRNWDLSGAACLKLGHCYTGPIYWRR